MIMKDPVRLAVPDLHDHGNPPSESAEPSTAADWHGNSVVVAVLE